MIPVARSPLQREILELYSLKKKHHECRVILVMKTGTVCVEDFTSPAADFEGSFSFVGVPKCITVIQLHLGMDHIETAKNIDGVVAFRSFSRDFVSRRIFHMGIRFHSPDIKNDGKIFTETHDMKLQYVSMVLPDELRILFSAVPYVCVDSYKGGSKRISYFDPKERKYSHAVYKKECKRYKRLMRVLAKPYNASINVAEFGDKTMYEVDKIPQMPDVEYHIFPRPKVPFFVLLRLGAKFRKSYVVVKCSEAVFEKVCEEQKIQYKKCSSDSQKKKLEEYFADVIEIILDRIGKKIPSRICGF